MADILVTGRNIPKRPKIRSRLINNFTMMKNLKSITASLLVVLFMSFLLSSCMTTKTSVGAFKETTGQDYTYAKGKQFWLFWGLVPLSRTNVNTPGDGNCEVVTQFNFGDFLITGLTAGIVTSYSIKVVAKK